MQSTQQLVEEFRPREWGDVIGQDEALKKLACLRKRGLNGKAYFLVGASGTGKTTIALLIAQETADDFNVIEIDDGGLLNAELLAQMSDDKRRRPFGKGCCWIINEAHRLSPAAITRLLGICEKMPPWFTVVFTTTSEAKADLFDERLDASPMLSRCHEIKLSRQGLCRPFAERIVRIARQAGLLNGHPDASYLPAAEQLCKLHKNNLRRCLQEVEAGYFAEGDK